LACSEIQSNKNSVQGRRTQSAGGFKRTAKTCISRSFGPILEQPKQGHAGARIASDREMLAGLYRVFFEQPCMILAQLTLEQLSAWIFWQ
jgi:hypothetical protein